jgi:hypothetical protein
MDWEMEWGASTIWDGMWVFGIFAVILWAMYRAHMRNCEESPQPEAQPSILPSAADEIASRAEMLAQLMKQTGSSPAASAPPSGDR